MEITLEEEFRNATWATLPLWKTTTNGESTIRAQIPFFLPAKVQAIFTKMAVNTQKILKELISIAPVDVWIERCKILESYAPESWLVIPEQTCFGEKGNSVLPVEACGVQQWDISIAMGYEYLSNSQRYHFPL